MGNSISPGEENEASLLKRAANTIDQAFKVQDFSNRYIKVMRQHNVLRNDTGMLFALVAFELRAHVCAAAGAGSGDSKGWCFCLT